MTTVRTVQYIYVVNDQYALEQCAVVPLFVLTTAHVGSFHSPDVGATQVTRLHHVHLVRAEPVIQWTVRLWKKMCRQFTGMQKREIFKIKDRDV